MKLSWLDQLIIVLTFGAVLALLASVLFLGIGLFRQNTFRQNPVSTGLPTAEGNLKDNCTVDGVALNKDYLPFIRGASQKYGIGQNVIAGVILKESRWDHTARNKDSGAQGLMQLMPATYEWLRNTGPLVKDTNGKAIDSTTNVNGVVLKNDPYDPETNIYLGTEYLAYLTRGDPPGGRQLLWVVLAAYNDGPGNVDDHIMPPEVETQNYVRLLLGGKPYDGTAGFIGAYKKCLDTTGVTGAIGQVKIADGANLPGHPLQQILLDYLARMAGTAGRTITVTTGTNHNQYTVDGNVSDHYTGNAADIGVPDDSAEGDAIFRACLIVGGRSEQEAARWVKTGGLVTIPNYNGQRIQCIWKTNDGGNHHNHVHVGVRPAQ